MWLSFFVWFQFCYASFKSRFKVQMFHGLTWFIWGCLMGSIELMWVFVVLIGFLNKFANHFLLFQDTLTYQHAIALCHSWQIMGLQVVFHIKKPKQYMKWWWKCCHRSWLVVSWIKAMDIGYLGTCCNSSSQRHMRFVMKLVMWLTLMAWVIQRQMHLM